MKTRHFMSAILAGTMLFTVGCGTNTNTAKPANGHTTPTPTQPAKVDVPAQDQVEVTIYRSDDQAMQVVKEMLPLAKMESDEKRTLAIFQLLKSPPKDANTFIAVPQEVELNGVTFKDGVMTLDFNNNVHKLQGSATETMFVDAVTMTMFDNFPQVSQIQFFSNGEPAVVLTNMSVKNGFVRPSNGRAMTTPENVSPQLAKAVVERYFFLTANGDYKSAWNLIDPGVEKVAQHNGTKPKETFLAQQGKGLPLVSACNVRILDEYKPLSTGVMVLNVAEVTCKLSDGQEKIVHLSRDQQGNWRLFWNAEKNSLE